MANSVTLQAWSLPRALSLVAGVGMAVFSALTLEHFFAANYPVSIFEGSFCDISAFFNCDSSAYSSISAVGGVPIGWFGMALGGLFALGALVPSEPLERTNAALSALNVLGVVALLLYSVLVLGSLCLLCTGFYLFSFLAFGLFWRIRPEGGVVARWLRPSPAHLLAFASLALAGAWGVREYHSVRKDAQVGGVASRVVSQFYSLPTVPWPSEISSFWSVRGSDDFEGVPVRVVEYGDPLCIDCKLLHEQLGRLAAEFAGRINVAYQFFPLEAACNDVVEKDKHPGACELSYMLAGAGDDFAELLDEVYENMRAAEAPEWRTAFAGRHDLVGAVQDPAVRARVHRLMRTGVEYEATHPQFPHGIRSTPTMIVNNRMIIGTLPYDQLRAIFLALVDEHERQGASFIEGWEPTTGD